VSHHYQHCDFLSSSPSILPPSSPLPTWQSLFFFVVLGFEFRASHLLDRYFTTWAPLPALTITINIILTINNHHHHHNLSSWQSSPSLLILSSPTTIIAIIIYHHYHQHDHYYHHSIIIITTTTIIITAIVVKSRKMLISTMPFALYWLFTSSSCLFLPNLHNHYYFHVTNEASEVQGAPVSKMKNQVTIKSRNNTFWKFHQMSEQKLIDWANPVVLNSLPYYN
jgi:hypothetical protein